MAIIDIFSKRQKRLRGEVPDIYVYDNIPQTLKVQIVHIINDAIGYDRYHGNDDVARIYKIIHNALCREYGVFKLGKNEREDYKEQVINFFLQSELVDYMFDVVELSFRCIDRIIREDWQYANKTDAKLTPDQAIIELNERFRESGIGYSFAGGKIIRIDSTYIHSEITKPTIELLWNKKFIGANEEYLKAHDHYKHNRNKECLNDCLKAFESTMKIICNEKGWAYAETDTAKKLIQICFQNGLVPTFTQNQFTSLQNLLTVRSFNF